MSRSHFQNPRMITPEDVVRYVAEIEKVTDIPQTKRGVAYVRKSRFLDESVHYSPEIQEQQCREFAESRSIEVVKVISDLDKTGKNSDRPGMQEVLRMAKNREFDYLILQYLDRGYRNSMSMFKLFEKLAGYGIKILSVHENIDTQTFHGRFMLFIYSIMAEQPIFIASERGRMASSKRREKGLPQGGYRLGYCNGLCSMCEDPNGKGYCPLFGQSDRVESQHGRIQVPYPIERHAILIVVNLYRCGWSGREIASYLNDHIFKVDRWDVKFRTKGIPGYKLPGTFSPEGVMDIVKSLFYVGYVAHFPTAALSLLDDLEDPRKYRQSVKNRRIPQKVYAGLHEALYPSELWEENQAIRTSKYKRPENSSKSSRVYLLTGVAQCWECSPYVKSDRIVSLRGSTNGSGKQIYRCAGVHGRKNDIEAKIDLPSVPKTVRPERQSQNLRILHPITSHPAESLEMQVEKLVSKLVIPEEWYERIAAYVSSDDGLSANKLKSYNLLQELKKYKDLRMSGDIDSSEYYVKRMNISKELKNLSPTSDAMYERTLPLLKDFRKVWQKLSRNSKRALLRIMFDRIYFDGHGNIAQVLARAPFDDLLNIQLSQQDQ